MFYKEKGFYISLMVGIVAIVAFSAICLNTVGIDKVADSEPPIENNLLASATMEPETTPEVTVEPEAEEVAKNVPAKTTEPTSTPKAAKTNVATIHFNQEKGLLWPVTGNVLLEYSPDKVIYFKTLAQYRTNSAMIIESKVGVQVKASAKGVVKSISNDDEIGKVVTMSIGDNFTVSYGQLKDITVKKGDSIKEGQVIGKIAKPTKYYSVEGPNLYYQVKSGKDTVNPMVLLR